MKQIILTSLFLLLTNFPGFCQEYLIIKNSPKSITPLKNNTWEIKEFTRDSVLIYKGTLSSIEPEVRHGRFYFYTPSGKVMVTGLYKQDIPYGTWVYYSESLDTLKVINYTAVWDYLEKDAKDFKIDPEVLNSLKKKDKETMNPDGTFYSAETMPTFNGGDPEIEFPKYIQENMIYPIYSVRNADRGNVDLEFTIDSEGKVRNPVFINPLNPDMNIEALRILSESPAWTPAYHKGMPVNLTYQWTFKFLPGFTYSIFPTFIDYEGTDQREEFPEEEVYFIVEDMPLFNRGDPAIEFTKFISQNLIYPKKAAETGIQGRVIVQFAVSPTGKVVDVVSIPGGDPLLEAEAVRVVSSPPLWTPGRQRGKSVKVLFTFPINFILGGK